MQTYKFVSYLLNSKEFDNKLFVGQNVETQL